MGVKPFQKAELLIYAVRRRTCPEKPYDVAVIVLIIYGMTGGAPLVKKR
jgi:hypothetical protein